MFTKQTFNCHDKLVSKLSIYSIQAGVLSTLKILNNT